MTIKQMIHAEEICDEIISIISAALKTSWGLKEIQFGQIDYMPAPLNMANFVPGVFVRPYGEVTNNFRQIGKVYQPVYKFRVVYVNKYAKGENPVELKTQKARILAELFMDSLDLNGLVLTNATIEWVLVTGIEWEPPEDDFVYTTNSNLFAFAINLEVAVMTES
ncbi:MAG: hypothetical protein V1709_00750 [Planctomycetota bacterium]